MKFLLSAIFFVLLNVFSLDAQEVFTPPVKSAVIFAKGEKLTYQIKYGFIVGGVASLTIKEAEYMGKKVFYAMAVGQTTGLANAIYGVEDAYESWFDQETNLPIKSVRDIREGNYTKYNEVTFNRKTNTVDSKLSGIHNVPAKILDLTSTVYYLRRVDFSKINQGDIVFVNLYFSDEIFPLRIKYAGKETIRTKFGKMECKVLKPVVEVGRMFNSADDLTIWFSDDERCMPVQVEMEIRLVGSVYLKLINIEFITSTGSQKEFK